MIERTNSALICFLEVRKNTLESEASRLHDIGQAESLRQADWRNLGKPTIATQQRIALGLLFICINAGAPCW
jgi:hypothetical protein